MRRTLPRRANLRSPFPDRVKRGARPYMASSAVVACTVMRQAMPGLRDGRRRRGQRRRVPPACVLWSESDGIVDLETLPAPFDDTSDAWGINKSGRTVGRSCDVDGNCHAVLWQNDAIRDLNELGHEDVLVAAFEHRRPRPDHRPGVRRRDRHFRRLRRDADAAIGTSRDGPHHHTPEPEWSGRHSGSACGCGPRVARRYSATGVSWADTACQRPSRSRHTVV
jgi:probable HAF family extracellular repeat protein